jgi:Glycosyltransferase family 87
MRLMASTAYRRPVLWWVGTRLLLLLWALEAVPWFSHGAVLGDVKTYSGWAQLMQTQGTFPSHDPQWQYPPGAALIMLFPQIFFDLGFSYIVTFFLFALAADFAIFRLLLGQAHRISLQTGEPAHESGLWAWICGGFAIGPLMLMRYDVIVTALAVGGLLATAGAAARGTDGGETERAQKRSWIVRGGLTGLGAIIKVWPVVLLAGLPNGKYGRRALASAVATALAVTAILCAIMPGGLSFLTGQYGRGIEVESVLASPFMVASWFGYHVETVHEYGAFQIAGAGVNFVGSCSLLLTVLGLALVLWWRLRRFKAANWTPALMYDVALTVVLVMVVTNRVLSPQYLIWLMGLAAVCLAENGPTRRATVMATPARLVMACVLITQVEFPILFGEVMGHAVLGTTVVALRNGTLLLATVLAIKALWQASTQDSAPADSPVDSSVDGPAEAVAAQALQAADSADAAAGDGPAGDGDRPADTLPVDGIPAAAGAPVERRR